ncbi:jacalin-related lectin 19 [Macadamia integrifolia]|uniref:jacalin-related lectin 19 n=1 Tax=Macadamia integrifolia TaxID=60698 RepID=UPI001C52A734|nr:jacalin-related lectin 19 [Macadamia integrifolia]
MEINGPRKITLAGQRGGDGGTIWDDGKYTGVREIIIVYDRCIDSIRVVYDKNGKPFQAQKHGGNGGNHTATIKLIYPEEHIVAVSGHYCPVVYGGTPVIRSLTFKTNTRTLGPYGVEEGRSFTISMDGDLIIGFMGRSGWYLDAIGFRLSRAQITTSICHKVQQQLIKLRDHYSKSSTDHDIQKKTGH